MGSSSGRNPCIAPCCFQSDTLPRHPPSVASLLSSLSCLCSAYLLFYGCIPKYQTSLAVMPDNKSLAGGGSLLFSGFRVLGLYSNHVPHAVRYHQKHREFYLVTAVGKSFHTYNVSTFWHNNYCVIGRDHINTKQIASSVFCHFVFSLWFYGDIIEEFLNRMYFSYCRCIDDAPPINCRWIDWGLLQSVSIFILHFFLIHRAEPFWGNGAIYH